MAELVVELPLYSDPYYSYSVSLEGDSYRIKFTYNSIMELYTLGILDADGNTLISGVGLVPNYSIALDYVISNLTGTFLLLPIADSTTEFYKLYPKNLNTYYKLYYYYDDSTVE